MKKIIILFLLSVSGTNYSMERIYSALQRINEVQVPTISLRNLQLLIVAGGAGEMLIGSYKVYDEMIYGGIFMCGAGIALMCFDTCMQKRDRRRLRARFPEPESNDNLV